MRTQNACKNQRGIITLDFIFSMGLVITLSSVLFALALTLSTMSITQYIAYSSSRALMLGNSSLQTQQQAAQAKFEALKENSGWAPLFANEWFELGEPEIGNHNELFAEGREGQDNYTFWGVRVPLIARILEIRTPVFGSTTTEEGRFRANMNSFLSREPSFAECQDGFFKERIERIRALGSFSNSAVNIAPAVPDELMLDNGC